MMKIESQKPVPLPVLLVYGKPARADLPQAAWFRTEDRVAVLAAAQNLKYATIEIKTEGEPNLLEGVYEGVLKGGGRMIVGSVSAEVYRRLEAYASQAAKTKLGADDEKSSGKVVEEQSKNLSTSTTTAPAPAPTPTQTHTPAPAPAPTAPAADPPAHKTPSAAARAPVAETPPDPWSSLRIGAHVLAKLWETNGEPNGWWVATITDVQRDGGFFARWIDEPLRPAFRIDPKFIGMLHPDFDPQREWERKR